MKVAVVVACVLVGIATAQYYPHEEAYPPTPYQYGYKADGHESSHSHQESGDGAGRVQGSYTFQLADGRTRTVTYYADETGFHPTIETNELGTESKPAANAEIYSSAPTGVDAALQGEAYGYGGGYGGGYAKARRA